jgi:proline iminopeptidase
MIQHFEVAILVLCLNAFLTGGTGHCQDPQQGYVDSIDGVELFYRVMGSGADTIVVLHGGPGLHFEYLAPDLEPLAESHTVIFYDQRGAGRSTLISDSTLIHIGAHIEDLEAVRQHFGIEQMIVLGHSWGAGLAARYGRQYAQRLSALILVGAMAPRNVPHGAVFRERRSAWRDAATEARIAELMAQRDTTSDAQELCRRIRAITVRDFFYDPHDGTTLSRMRGDYCAPSDEARANSSFVNRLTWASIGEWDWRHDFANIHVPVLVIHGAGDPMPIESAHEWVEAFPDARLVVLGGAGHNPYLERPEEFVRTIEEFLRHLDHDLAGPAA